LFIPSAYRKGHKCNHRNNNRGEEISRSHLKKLEVVF
jgi:hypothetical protein